MATQKKRKSTTQRKSAPAPKKPTKAELERQLAAEAAEEERLAAIKAAKEAARRDPDNPVNLVTFLVMLTVSFLSFIFLYFTKTEQGINGAAGPLGYWFYCLCFGLLGPSAYLLPIGLFYITFVRNQCIRRGTWLLKITSVSLFILFIAVGFQLMVQASDAPVNCASFPDLWNQGIARKGGGALGGMLGGALHFLLKNVAWMVLIPCMIIDILLLFEITPSMMRDFFARLSDNIRAYMAAERTARPKIKAVTTPKPVPVQPAVIEEEPTPEPAPKRSRRKVFGVDDEPAPAPVPTMEVAPVEMKKVEETGNAPDTIVVNPTTGEVIEPIYTPPVAKPISPAPAPPPVATPVSSKISDIRITDNRQAAFSQPAPMEEPVDDPLFARKEEEVDLAPWEDPIPKDSEAVDADSLFESAVTESEEDFQLAPVLPLTPEEEEIAAFLLDPNHEPDEDDPLPEAMDEPAPQDLPPAPPVYQFPPLSLLTQNVNLGATDDSDELRRNAEKLVSVLKSFRVSTEIVNVSHGPTITRYELAPKEGVRVRAIANLVDDIALNLETSGVRIEAPIPGKAAVGIEVPNKSASTVYLRELLENPSFENSKSKVTCALGMDVAGTPVYLDIAKMPHLLIAGATGMGKSVCINSLIVSLLYKASPDEVKLILIDPKKVELNVYNKLPHLLVPVVNLPKKAAGSLSWAVGEMERRFELIEEVGVRDIKGYNQITANDPAKEFMPHIVIIIDELADLMMTAPDDVEESICRLAQKARAAGMHLIIGTQRPSVDVITGLIKANIPSRIAFTVASNIDSRTIIDVAGAEKLIGRGDMLYAPVGAMKPIRVQGSFVSDKEVEAVCDFIRGQVGDGEYNNAIMEEIDKNAEQCGQKKKAGAADLAASEEDGDIDPKFNEAVEVALEVGKISTSLLQRRLSLGYGRAAKIIDKMQQCGIVGPQEGQKPRNVLISHADWAEIKMRGE